MLQVEFSAKWGAFRKGDRCYVGEDVATAAIQAGVASPSASPMVWADPAADAPEQPVPADPEA